MLQEEALHIMKVLGTPVLRPLMAGCITLSSWLQMLKLGGVSEETVQAWMEKLKVLIEGYAPQIFGMRMKQLAFTMLYLTGPWLTQEGNVTMGKKQRIGSHLLEKKSYPFQATSPHCFKVLRDKNNHLGIPYHSNRTACLIFLPTSTESRLIRVFYLLIMSVLSLHNLLITFLIFIFLPQNTTSRLQSLDAGIIRCITGS